jgi:hypothetical protein
MSRNPDPLFDRRIADWLEQDPDTAPADLVRTVDGALPSITQRRAVRLPWRTMPMNRIAMLGAALAAVVIIGVGAATLGSRPSPSVGGPSVVPTASTDATQAYRQARNQVCDAALAAKKPLQVRFDRLWQSGITTAQRADAVAALRAFVTLEDGVVAQLRSLTPPQALLDDHLANATQLSDISTLVAYELSLIDAGNLSDAQAVDLATNPIARQTEAFESRNSLDPCL